MLRENTVFARKIIDFYTEKGVDCSVVDEHLSLLVTLSSDGREHEFRYGSRAFGGHHNHKKFCLVLDRELARLKAEADPAVKYHSRDKYRGRDEAAEEVSLNLW